jgi:hypothetical protein
MGDAWIRKPRQPLGTQISSTNSGYGCGMDWTAHAATRHSDIINELLSRVTHRFDSPHSPRD